MIDLECPNCSRRGTVPNDKVSTRLVCKKCHIVFHMTPTGRPMIGEPPAPVVQKARKGAAAPGLEAGVKALKQTEWVDSLFEINRVKLLFTFLVIGIVGIGCLAVLSAGGNDALAKKVERVAASLPAGDPSVVKGLAYPDGAATVDAWFDAAHSQYELMKSSSAGHGVRTSVYVMEENPVKQQGQAVIFLFPLAGSTRDSTIVKAVGAASTTGDPVIPQVMTYWVLVNGSWRLDAARMAETARH